MTLIGIAFRLASWRLASTGRTGFTIGHVVCTWVMLVLCVLYDLGVEP
jgi:tetrahydromethanopterin S-methyltransferase subunit F